MWLIMPGVRILSTLAMTNIVPEVRRREGDIYR